MGRFEELCFEVGFENRKRINIADVLWKWDPELMGKFQKATSLTGLQQQLRCPPGNYNQCITLETVKEAGIYTPASPLQFIIQGQGSCMPDYAQSRCAAILILWASCSLIFNFGNNETIPFCNAAEHQCHSMQSYGKRAFTDNMDNCFKLVSNNGQQHQLLLSVLQTVLPWCGDSSIWCEKSRSFSPEDTDVLLWDVSCK